MATPLKARKNVKNKPNSSPSPVKKKKTGTADDLGFAPEAEMISLDAEESRDSPITVSVEKSHVFKNPNFVHSSIASSGSKKTRNWKNLKQIVAAERALPWKPEDTTYGMIDAPPSFKPAMKYSDLSGLPASPFKSRGIGLCLMQVANSLVPDPTAKYTDPQTKLRFATSEEYSRIRMMPSDLVTGCLTLRRANVPV